MAGKAALEAIVGYMKQCGTYVDGQAPFIECSYGSGEVAQAAVRACCVYGGVSALDTRAAALLVRHGTVNGVRLANGHCIACSTVIIPDALQAAVAVGTDVRAAAPGGRANTGGEAAAAPDTVARAVALVNAPVLADSKNIQVVVPPQAAGNECTVTVWQCDASLRACPAGHWLLYFSAPSGGRPAADVLTVAIDAILSSRQGDAGTEVPSPSRDTSAAAANRVPAADRVPAAKLRPPPAEMPAAETSPSPAQALAARHSTVCVLCFYTQLLYGATEPLLPAGVERCAGPGAERSLDRLAAQAAIVFGRICPGCEFLAKQAPPENASDGGSGNTPAPRGEQAGGAVAEREDAADDLDAALLALGLSD